MIANSELYGFQSPPPVPKEVIDERVHILQIELDKELAIYWLYRNSVRVHKIYRAISFWRNINENDS